MNCFEFWAWLGSGVLVVPLPQFLKTLPKVGPVFEQWAWLAAPLLSAILPQIAALAQPYCGQIDPLLWATIYAALTYLVSQILYHLAKQAGRIA